MFLSSNLLISFVPLSHERQFYCKDQKGSKIKFHKHKKTRATKSYNSKLFESMSHLLNIVLLICFILGLLRIQKILAEHTENYPVAVRKLIPDADNRNV